MLVIGQQQELDQLITIRFEQNNHIKGDHAVINDASMIKRDLQLNEITNGNELYKEIRRHFFNGLKTT